MATIHITLLRVLSSLLLLTTRTNLSDMRGSNPAWESFYVPTTKYELQTANSELDLPATTRGSARPQKKGLALF